MDLAAHRALARQRQAPAPSRVAARTRRRRRRARRVARAALVLVLELAVAYAIVAAVRVSPSEPAAAPPPLPGPDDVAAAPKQFRGETVTIRGRIVDRATRVPEGDRRPFVLGGRKGGRLLVVRGGDTRGMAFKIGTMVQVSGTVVVPPDSRQLRKRPASRAAIAKRMRAAALIKATRVAVTRSR